MVNPFGDGADFSGITTTDTLKIDRVFHKAFIDVGEEKTEAAAATAVVMGAVETSIELPPPPPILFRADHPFIFMIMEKTTKSILFMGRLSDPSKLVEN
jgi:serpin B